MTVPTTVVNGSTRTSTCTAGDANLLGSPCTSAAACGTGGFCSQAQEDGDLDSTGDACEPVFLPEAGSGLGLALGAVALAAMARRRRLQAPGASIPGA
jgi:hypothetical protein